MENEPKPEHRLAAFMATHVVAYSQSMQFDEARTLAALSAVREAIDKQIKHHRGRIANTAGDSVLAEFGSAVEAVSCAMALQAMLSSESEVRYRQLRIGIHLGDVVDKAGDLFWTAVNVAARLEGVAHPGGIVVSGAVRDAIAGKLAAVFTDLGALKNIDEPLRAYELSYRAGSLAPGAPRERESLPLPPTKPSIAVLPFDDLSANRDQEYFADGVAEEIITALSRFPRLFVVARNSSFAYRGRSLDVKQIGRELGVRYILEGSVRKAGARVRITGILYAGTQPLIAKFRLIDASTGAHLWADRFDGNLEDIFDLQDHVTASVIGAIAPKLEQAEIERSMRKPTESLDAYDYYLRGMAGLHLWTKEGNKDALSHFYRTIELDPSFASAYGMAARCLTQRKAGGWFTDHVQETTETVRLARKATDLGRGDAIALAGAGIALAYVGGELEEGAALIQRSLILNPNLAWGWFFSSMVKLWLGEPETAIDHSARAMRLSPNDTHKFNMQSVMAYAHLVTSRIDEAVSWGEMAVRERSTHLPALRALAAIYALSGRDAEASKVIVSLRELDPSLRLSNLPDVIPLRRPEDLAILAEGLRRAGLPE
jgi:TolB-like protein/class 3 adenylate cyclase